jgi:DNA-binding HxlR family transcriptional regulator
MSRYNKVKQYGDAFSKPTLEKLLRLARQMDSAGVRVEDPVREVFSLLGDKWSKLILLTLNTGTFGYGELLRTLNCLAWEGAPISKRILTLKLRALERDGLVVKELTDDYPPKSEYRLSQLGVELTGIVSQLIRWIEEHSTVIEESRSAFEEDSEQ